LALLPILEMLKPEILSVQCLIRSLRELGIAKSNKWKKWELITSQRMLRRSRYRQKLRISNSAVLIGTPGRIADHIDRGTFV
jgi:superfamily II DNA/RNA helicase